MVVFRRKNPFEPYRFVYEDYASEGVVEQVIPYIKIKTVEKAFENIKKVQGSVYIIPEDKLNDLLKQMNT